jgi:hypothetical protein
MENWPEARRREVVVYAVREISSWALLGEPLPTSLQLQVKVLDVWKDAVSIYPHSGFGQIPGKLEGQYVSDPPESVSS